VSPKVELARRVYVEGQESGSVQEGTNGTVRGIAAGRKGGPGGEERRDTGELQTLVVVIPYKYVLVQ